MPSIEFDFKKTFSDQKILEVLKKCKTEIQVGWPSGRQHVEAVHEVEQDENGNKILNKDGSYKTTNRTGTTTKNETPVETWELARDLHFGTAEIPARPFFDDAMEQPENREKISKAFQEQIKKLAEGQQPNWAQVGVIATGIVQEFIRSDYYKSRIPNSPETIKLKHSDTPLIDAADLVNSLAFIVEDKK